MQHTFTQKLILVLLLAALTAGAYVIVYKKIIVGSEQAINAGYKTPTPAPAHTPLRRY